MNLLDDAILTLLTQKTWTESQITALQTMIFSSESTNKKEVEQLRGRIKSYEAAIDILSKYRKKTP